MLSDKSVPSPLLPIIDGGRRGGEGLSAMGEKKHRRVVAEKRRPFSKVPLLLFALVGAHQTTAAFAEGGAGGSGGGGGGGVTARLVNADNSDNRDRVAVPSNGLLNMGNTCYINAQLECAYHVPRVRDLIISPSLSKPTTTTTTTEPSCPPDEKARDEWKEDNSPPSAALLALGQVFRAMYESSSSSPEGNNELGGGGGGGGGGRPISTFPLCRTLNIDVSIQQDSQEFWKLLLPELNSVQLSDLYQGSYEDYIVALDGSERERRREEPFLDLSLEVTGGSLYTAMEDLFGKPELLSEKEGNGWRPEKGAEKVDALKGSLLRVQGLPSILQFHLKRFNYDWQTGVMSKINNRLVFPKELDLSKICTGIQKDEIPQSYYDLQSVVIHVGEYESGHYYSYVRPDIRKDVWYRFDDHRVTEVTYRDVWEDSFGGRNRSGSSSKSTRGNKTKKRGLFERLFNLNAGQYGWGGPTSSAYMLQYVRRCDIPMLYGEE